MKADQLLNQILPILQSVKDDEEKLQRILDFMLKEIYEEPDNELVIPEKYHEIVRRIAENIDCGLVCFLNPETFEIEEVPASLAGDPEEYEMTTGEIWEDTFHHQTWGKCITVEKPESSDSFGIMERFVDEVEDINLKKRLVHALNNRKPFANFKNLIENSKYREQWFAFKQKELEKHVWQNLEFEI